MYFLVAASMFLVVEVAVVTVVVNWLRVAVAVVRLLLQFGLG
jgi:hypothetical protein